MKTHANPAPPELEPSLEPPPKRFEPITKFAAAPTTSPVTKPKPALTIGLCRVGTKLGATIAATLFGVPLLIYMAQEQSGNQA